MKKNLFSLFALLLIIRVAFAQSPSTSQNYVLETTVRVPNKTTEGALSSLPAGDVLRTITYIDGLGRPIQINLSLVFSVAMTKDCQMNKSLNLSLVFSVAMTKDCQMNKSLQTRS